MNWPWGRPKDNYFVLLTFIISVELVGILGSLITFPAISNWYIYLNKPFFSPPNWLFAPVWTFLYALIGISAYLIWRQYKFGKKAHKFWTVFFLQLALNALWSPVFFGAKWIGVALIVILAMWYYIYRSLTEGKRLVPWSGYLLYPYLAWVSFATFLNLALLVLN